MKNVFSLLTVFVGLNLFSCALIVPSHQLHPPQTLGAGGVRVGVVFAGNPSAGPDVIKNDNTTLNNGVISDLSFGYGLTVGVLDFLDVDCELLASFSSGGTTVCGAKLQFLGSPIFEAKEGDVNASIRGRMIQSSGYKDTNEDGTKSSDSIFKDIYIQDLSATGYSMALSIGRQHKKWFGTFLGATYLNMDLKTKYTEGSATGTILNEDRNVKVYGPFIGFSMTPGGEHFGFEWTAELSALNAPHTFDSSKRDWETNFGSSVNLLFRF